MKPLPLLPVDSEVGLPVTRARQFKSGIGMMMNRTIAFTLGAFATAADTAGSAIDGALSIVSPAVALQRKYARDAYRRVRGFDAADRNRLTGNRFPTARDADAELNGKQSRIRGFAREEVRNNAIASNLKHTHERNTIGDADAGQGISIKSAVLNLDGTPDDKTNKILDDAWEKYSDKLEYSGRWGFTDCLHINDGELTEAGEVLNILHDRPAPGSDLPLSVELLEVDRLPMNCDTFLPQAQNGEFIVADKQGMPIINPITKQPVKHYIKHGIEYDENRQICAFHVLKDHPGAETFLGTTFQTLRYPRERVIHYFRPERAEQTRGVSWFIAALALLADMRDLLSWELIAAKAQACFGIHFGGSGVPNLPVPSNTVNPPKDLNGNPVSQVQPGMATVGESKVEFYGGNRPGGTFLPFFQSIARLCGAAFGIGYSATTKDFSQGAYSALRAEDNEDARAYGMGQGLHARHFCKRIRSAFVKACAQVGIISAKEYLKDPTRFERCTIKFPRRKHINPLQERTAEAVSVKNGFQSPYEICDEDPKQVIAEIAEVVALAKDAGVALGYVDGQIKPKLNQKNDQQENSGDDLEVDDEELAAVGVESNTIGSPDK